jgi:hypothetical protein
MGINPFLKQKTGDKTGAEFQWVWNEQDQRYEPKLYWEGEWDTNADQREQLYAGLAGLALMGGGAAAVGTGVGGAGAGGAAGGVGGFTLPSLETILGVGSKVVGGIGTANSLANMTTGSPLVGRDGHIYDSSPNTGKPSPTRPGGTTVTQDPNNPSGGGPGGGGGTGTGTGTGGDMADFLGLFFDVAGQAYSADRQESTADKLQAMYNDQQAKAAPWEERLARSYTPEGIQDIMKSPEFMNENYSYKQAIDRKAAKAGTLTNSMSGILGDPSLARGRDAALQRFGLEYLDKYRKPIADQVGLYTKNAADYRMLAALGLASEQNIPSQWANTLAKYRNPNGSWNIPGAMRDIANAGGNIWKWFTNPSGTNPDGNTTGGNTGNPPGSVMGGGDPAHDNPDYPNGGTIQEPGFGGTGPGGPTGVVGPDWDYSMQEEGVIYDPDGNAWMPDPVTGDWSIAEVP